MDNLFSFNILKIISVILCHLLIINKNIRQRPFRSIAVFGSLFLIDSSIFEAHHHKETSSLKYILRSSNFYNGFQILFIVYRWCQLIARSVNLIEINKTNLQAYEHY